MQFQFEAFQIYQGGKFVITVRLINPMTGDPYDLTTCTAISTCFQNTDGTELMLSLLSGVAIVSPATFGKITITGTAAQAALLAVVQLATLQLSLTFSGDPSNPIVVQIPNAYNVNQTQC